MVVRRSYVAFSLPILSPKNPNKPKLHALQALEVCLQPHSSECVTIGGQYCLLSMRM